MTAAAAPAEAPRTSRSRVLLLGWQPTIGSGIAAIPAIAAVRDHFGEDSELWLLTRWPDRSSAHPVTLLTPWMRLRGQLYLPRLRQWLDWIRLLATIRSLRFDTAVYVDLSTPHRDVRRLLTLVSRLAGLGRPLGLRTKPTAARPMQEAARRLANLANDGVAIPSAVTMPALEATAEARVVALLSAHRRPGRLLVALCPGARATANLWPIDRFAALGQKLVSQGGHDLVVVGGPAESAAARSLIAGWGEGIDAAGTFSLSESAALLAACDLVVGLDTGTSHLAAAVGTPVIVLQGARCPAGQWDPLGSNVAILRTDVPCAGCGHAACPLTLHPCMRAITLDAVWRAVERLLGKA